MSDRNIECNKCSTNLGVIRDARIRTDIEFSCGTCTNAQAYKIKQLELEVRKLKAIDRLRPDPPQTDTSKMVDDLFGDIFSKRR